MSVSGKNTDKRCSDSTNPRFQKLIICQPIALPAHYQEPFDSHNGCQYQQWLESENRTWTGTPQNTVTKIGEIGNNKQLEFIQIKNICMKDISEASLNWNRNRPKEGKGWQFDAGVRIMWGKKRGETRSSSSSWSLFLFSQSSFPMGSAN